MARFVSAVAMVFCLGGCGDDAQVPVVDGGDTGDGAVRPGRPDADPDQPDAALATCSDLFNPTPCDTVDGLEVYCTVPGGTLVTFSRVSYDSSDTIVAMGVGTVSNPPDGQSSGFLTMSTPMTCTPTPCPALGVGTGNSAGSDGKICEVTFDTNVTGPSQGEAVYTIVADADATPGDYTLGYGSNAGTTAEGPNFVVRVLAP